MRGGCVCLFAMNLHEMVRYVLPLVPKGINTLILYNLPQVAFVAIAVNSQETYCCVCIHRWCRMLTYTPTGRIPMLTQWGPFLFFLKHLWLLRQG